MKNKTLFAFAISLLAGGSSLCAQAWTEIDTFDNGQPAGTWTSAGTPTVDYSANNLKLSLVEGSVSTSTLVTALPTSYSTGKFTIVFDLYLPSGIVQNQFGFGVGSASQLTKAGWSPVGERNRFQTVNTTNPQNLTKVPEWTEDALGTTEQGTWYNIWLVYDLDANPQTVTIHSKPATAAASDIISTTFDFNGDNNDDWSAISHFGVGIGPMDLNPLPDGYVPSDSLGGIVDNIYVSTGENLTASPTAFNPTWEVMETFANNAASLTWEGDLDSLDLLFADGALTVKGNSSTSRVNTYVPLPASVSSARFTVSFDMLLPGDSGSLSQSVFSVVGADQVALSGANRMGGNDRFITFGASPQSLTKYTAWTSDLLGDTALNQWYHVWLVYDADSLQVEFYGVPFDGALPTEPSGVFDLVTDYAEFSYFVVGAEIGGNTGITLDNIYFANAELIELSPTAGQIGGPAPCTSFFTGDEDVKDSSLGLINDGAFPYVYLYDLAAWAYVSGCAEEQDTEADGFIFYVVDSQVWGMADADWQGWWYQFGDQSDWIPPVE